MTRKEQRRKSDGSYKTLDEPSAAAWFQQHTNRKREIVSFYGLASFPVRPDKVRFLSMVPSSALRASCGCSPAAAVLFTVGWLVVPPFQT